MVKNAKSILILTHANPDGDAVGSTLALKMALDKLGKTTTLAISGDLPKFLNFLPQFDQIENNPTLTKDLLIMIDESQAKVGNISLKRVAENKLVVVVTPKDGLITPANIRVEEGFFNADLIIVVDSANLDRLGNVYTDNPNLFYEVPVVNIDHHPSNTNFGKVNIIDTTASSTAEILVSLIETIGKDVPNIINADIATCLLTGITTDTSSFQNGNTTPKSLTVAAQMVAAGANQQEIVQRIYRTRSLSTLRLWGRALSYIKEDRPNKFAWSILTKADFVASQAGAEEASGVVDELLKTVQGMDFVLLLTERDGGVHGSFRSINPTIDVSRLANLLGGGGHAQAAAFQIPSTTLAAKENEIIAAIRNALTGAKPSATPPTPATEAAPTSPEPTADLSEDSAQQAALETQAEEPSPEPANPAPNA